MSKEEWRISTITVEGMLSNISFQEMPFFRQIAQYGIQPQDKVLCVGVNGLKPIYHPNEYNTNRIIRMRDRKKPSKSKRGTEFNSSVAFYIQPDITDESGKIYVVKLFRTGCFDCLGVLRADYSDFLPVVDILCAFLERNLREFDRRFPITSAFNEINRYIGANGEPPIRVTHYIGPIRMISLHCILQIWLYHINLERGQTLNLQALSNDMDSGGALVPLLKQYELTVIEKVYSVGSVNIRIIFGAPELRSVTTLITRYGKVNVSGLRENSFVSRIQGFYQSIDVSRYIMNRAIPDSERDDISDDDGDIIALITRSNLNSGRQTPASLD